MVQRFSSDSHFVTSGAIFDRARDRDLNQYLRGSEEFYCWWCGKSGTVDSIVVEHEMPYHPECIREANPNIEYRISKQKDKNQNLKTEKDCFAKTARNDTPAKKERR